jgi:hypothetical protein
MIFLGDWPEQIQCFFILTRGMIDPGCDYLAIVLDCVRGRCLILEEILMQSLDAGKVRLGVLQIA